MSRLLVVDDSAMSRRTLRVIMESAGHQVVEASDADTALESYFLTRPDAVFLDMVMRGKSGLEALAQLMQLDRDARIIIASADIQDSTREMCQAGGARGFISKPFLHKEVLAAVQAVLAGESLWISS